MEIQYIFLLKEKDNTSLKHKEAHYNFLNKLFIDVKKYTFNIKYKGKEYMVNYKVLYNNNLDMFRLSISLDTSENAEEVLSEVDKIIRKGEIRKDYKVIITYDGVSEYYSNKAHKTLNRFERKLRELVYIILAKTFGLEWYDKTVNDELDKKLKEISKGKNKSALIESALQEMTLYDLELYLFTPYAEMDFNYMIQTEKINKYMLNETNKEEIISMLSLCIPKSLWERFFEKIINIKDIQDKLEKIRNYRNKVAHCKEFNINDYIYCKSIIDQVLNKISIAIEEINIKEFDADDLKESCYAYNSFIKLNMQMQEQALKIQKAVEVPSVIREMQEQALMIQKAVEVPSVIREIQEQDLMIQKAVEVPSAIRQIQEQALAIQKVVEVPSVIREIQEQDLMIQKGVEVPSAIREIQEQALVIQKVVEVPSAIRQIQEQALVIQKVVEVPSAILQIQEQALKIQKVVEVPSAIQKIQEQETKIQKAFKVENIDD